MRLAASAKSRGAPALPGWQFAMVGVVVVVMAACGERPRAAGAEAPDAVASDTARADTAVTPVVDTDPVAQNEPQPPLVALDVAAQQASAAVQQTSGTVGEISIDGRPRPWDIDHYRRDPSAYLNRVEPARIHQTAPDEPSYPRLVTPGGHTAERHRVTPLGSIDLVVMTRPGFPATLTSLDRGAFQNGLTTITVQADADGRATARFTATAGTVAHTRIVAASPVARGQVDFSVLIAEP